MGAINGSAPGRSSSRLGGSAGSAGSVGSPTSSCSGAFSPRGVLPRGVLPRGILPRGILPRGVRLGGVGGGRVDLRVVGHARLLAHGGSSHSCWHTTSTRAG